VKRNDLPSCASVNKPVLLYYVKRNDLPSCASVNKPVLLYYVKQNDWSFAERSRGCITKVNQVEPSCRQRSFQSLARSTE